MISTSQAVDLAAKIYDPKHGDFQHIFNAGKVNAGLSMVDNTLCVTFRGTDNVLDAIRDIFAVPYHHPQLGVLHAGFWLGMGDMFVRLRPYLQKAIDAGIPISITCHSLGCPHGAILAGLCAINHIPIAQLFLFAPPRPGYQSIRDIVQKHVPMIGAYRNGPDPVPLQFLTLPFFPWCDIADLELLNSAPDGWLDEHDPMEWHHVALYKSALS